MVSCYRACSQEAAAALDVVPATPSCRLPRVEQYLGLGGGNLGGKVDGRRWFIGGRREPDLLLGEGKNLKP